MHVPTVEDVLKPYQHYPKVIQQAILLVDTHPSFSILTKATRRVLQRLLSRVSKHDGMQAIRARLDVVADSAEVNYKTAQRAMARLKAIGWVTQVCDGRSDYGVFQARHYQFSPALCALVRLPCAGQAEEDSCREPTMSDGSIYDLTFKKDQRAIAKEKQKTTPITLPNELQEIVALGVKDTGVCKLRGLAHAAGYRLEDIWQVAKARLDEIGARAGRVYRYLATMIGRPSDYARRAGQEARISAERTKLIADMDRARQGREQALKDSLAQAEDKVKAAIESLPNGRESNLALLRMTLKTGRKYPAPGISV